MKLRSIPTMRRKESKVVQELKDYFQVVQGAVTSFSSLVQAIAEGRSADAKRFFQLVLDGENSADDAHRSLSMEIAEGAFFGGIREDILDLLETMDSIADSAKDASRFLESEEDLDSFAHALLASEEMGEFVSELVGAVSALGELIAAFDLGKKVLLSRVPVVEEWEEKADASKDRLMKQLFQSGQRPDPVTVIQMRDFLFVADDIADNAEDSSDVVLVLVAKGYD